MHLSVSSEVSAVKQWSPNFCATINFHQHRMEFPSLHLCGHVIIVQRWSFHQHMIELPSLHVYIMENLTVCQKQWHSQVQALLAIRKSERLRNLWRRHSQLWWCKQNDGSSSARLAGSEVLLCNLIPLDLILLQSWGFHMLAVVSTIDSFGTVICVLVNFVVISTVFCFLNFISKVPSPISLLLALFRLSVQLSDHHSLQFAF